MSCCPNCRMERSQILDNGAEQFGCGTTLKKTGYVQVTDACREIARLQTELRKAATAYRKPYDDGRTPGM